jgi:hypothetical protein
MPGRPPLRAGRACAAADYLGLTIETVSRTFSRFKADRRIATPSNSEVVILDRAWLDGTAAGHLSGTGQPT